MSWHPASNGAGKRHWFVTREPGQAHENARGRIIWYASFTTAQAAADRLNAAARE